MDSSFREAIDAATERMTATSAVRDAVLVLGRQTVRLAANSVRAMHRGEFESAQHLLREARANITSIREQTRAEPAVYQAGYVQDAMKEYAEAFITLAVLRDEPVPVPATLEIEDAAWLNALAEAGSELRRDVLDLLRANNAARASTLLDRMDDIYAALVTIDFPDAITGGLRRTTDQFRAVLERTRADVTLTGQQHRLEAAILRLYEHVTPSGDQVS